jgi:hypothetical protein
VTRSHAIAALAAAALAAPGAAEAEIAAGTGLRGVLFVYPSRPVCPRGAACTKPAPGLSLVFYRQGKRAARTTTNGEGHYRVLLGPGTYTVKLWHRPAVRIAPARVVVPRSGIRRVDFTYDSGIR